jgi:hypothetical protein
LSPAARRLHKHCESVFDEGGVAAMRAGDGADRFVR